MTWCIARRMSDTLSLRDGEERPFERAPTAVVPDPADYNAFVLDMPTVAETEMDGLLRFRLRAEYPGDVDALVLSRHRLDGRAILVLAMDAGVLEEYRSAAPGARLYCVETLAFAAGRSKGACIDMGGETVSVVREPFRRVVTASGSAGCAEYVTDIYELLTRRSPRGLSDFSTRRRRSWWGVRVGIAAAICVTFAAALVARDVAAMRAAEAEASAGLSVAAAHLAETNETIRRHRAIEDELEALPNPPAYSPYLVLAALTEAGTITIRELTIRGTEVRLTATGDDPLRFANRLSAGKRFADVSLARVQPDATGSQRFSLTGVFTP